MVDKSFILTVVAVLAIAVLAGSLRNSYSGALTGSVRQPGTQYDVTGEQAYGAHRSYAAVEYTGGLRPLTNLQKCLRDVGAWYATCKSQTGDINYCTFVKNNKEEDCQDVTNY